MNIGKFAELLLLLIVLTDFAVLGSSRLSACIRAIAIQGVLLGVLSLVIDDPRSVHAMALAAGTVAIKGIVLPFFLRWAMREAAVRREVEPQLATWPRCASGLSQSELRSRWQTACQLSRRSNYSCRSRSRL